MGMNYQDVLRDVHDQSTHSLKTTSSSNSNTTVYLGNPTLYAVVNSLTTISLAPPGLGSRATYGNVSLTSIGTLILASDTTRRSVLVKNISTATVFIGTSSVVTTSTGIPLKTDDALTLDQYDGDVYGVGDATGQPVRFLAELD